MQHVVIVNGDKPEATNKLVFQRRESEEHF